MFNFKISNCLNIIERKDTFTIILLQKSRQKKELLKSESILSTNQQKLSSPANPPACSIFELYNIKHDQVFFDETFCQKNFDLKQESSPKHEQESTHDLIIGMHPDQATEPIIDMALKYKKPFAVVPCCVFAHENPHRRLKNTK